MLALHMALAKERRRCRYLRQMTKEFEVYLHGINTKNASNYRGSNTLL